jgi:hypothetical protein
MEPVTTPASREHCYHARDAYYSCISKSIGGRNDARRGIGAGAHEENREPCAVELKAYNEVCPKSWRKYFDGRRRAGKAQVEVGVYEKRS